MRRRVLPLVLTAAAGAAALVRRSRRRQPPDPPRYVAQPPTTALPAPAAPDDVSIDQGTDDPVIEPHAQVEREGPPTAAEGGPNAIHNVAAPSSPSPFRSVAWTLLDDPPSAEATELRIGFSLVARHESLARIDVRETSSQVFVTVLARFEPPAGGWFAYAEAHKAAVELRAPLGDRALVHAPTQEPGPPAPSPPDVPPPPGSPPPGSPPPASPPADEPAG